jgi:TolB-like protein/cytochrome c-type biogenesis protein CcmH/NrfG
VLQGLLNELKQRHVLRVAGVYTVSGWALFKAVASLFPALNLPTWSVTFVAALFLLGLPIVVIIAYAFERTPEGIRRAAPGSSEQAAPVGWFDWALLGTSVVIVVLAITQFATTWAQRAAPAAPPAAAGAPSIAVLPFVNFSDASDGEYFADGLTEELINDLAQLPGLKVAGRTSAFYFKGRNEDLREIGRTLGVAHVLEGSVRRSGDHLRITAQLIEVAGGFHLWSQTYDQTMSDAFLIQSQIAAAVAQVLKGQLLEPHPAQATGPARDPVAYKLELVAQGQARKHELTELQAARASYQQLIALEPDNARAQAGFAYATISLAQDFLALDFDTALTEAQAAVERALQLDPQSTDAWRVKGFINHVLSIRSGERTYNQLAITALRRAVELAPDNSDSLELLANELIGNGQPAQAVALLQKALAADPLSRLAQHLLGAALEREGRLTEARRQYESLVALYPDYTSARIALGELLRTQGKLDEAVGVLNDPILIQTDPVAGFYLANCYANLGMMTEMTAVLEGIREPPPAAALAQAVLMLRDGHVDELSKLAAEQLATTRDPIWRPISVVSRAVGGDIGSARALVADTFPGLVETPPATDEYSALDAILVAYTLRETGWPDQSTAIARAILASHETAPQEYASVETRWMRVLAYAVLDDTDHALGELRSAADGGYRTLIDFDYFVRLEDYPFMAVLAADPRFIAQVAEIEADTRRMREALLARRAQAAPAPDAPTTTAPGPDAT